MLVSIASVATNVPVNSSASRVRRDPVLIGQDVQDIPVGDLRSRRHVGRQVFDFVSLRS